MAMEEFGVDEAINLSTKNHMLKIKRKLKGRDKLRQNGSGKDG